MLVLQRAASSLQGLAVSSSLHPWVVAAIIAKLACCSRLKMDAARLPAESPTQ
jgi:hypothetical protein